jgi:protein-L-isoaspartate(D-aspartate) O-methyltransferase
MDYAEARTRMVDGQIRPNRVTEPRLLEALRLTPREAFVPAAAASRAYTDEEVPLPGGRALMQPMVLAKLLQLAAIRPDERVLVVCAGTGYGAALVARLGARVVALEPDAGLRAIATAALAAEAAGSLRLEAGDPTEGFAAAAPYDVILVEGEIPAVPEALSAQLAEGGRLVAVLAQGRGQGRGQGVAMLGRRLGGALTLTAAFDAAVAPLPAFQPAPGFVF